MNIWIAASDNNIERVKEFLALGHTVNDRDGNGYTCMHAAASYGHTDLLRYLVNECNGDINIQDTDGDTPLHVVEDLKTAKVIVGELKANYKIKNSEGQTALAKLQQDAEEDEEFAHLDVIEYLQTLSPETASSNSNGESSSGLVESVELPVPESSAFPLRYSYEAEIPEAINEDQRQKLEHIIHSDNPEAGLREFVQEIVHNQLTGGDSESHDSKKVRK